VRDRSDLGHDLDVDTRTTLLDVLREHLHLTGTKKGESISMLFLLNRSLCCGVGWWHSQIANSFAIRMNYKGNCLTFLVGLNHKATRMTRTFLKPACSSVFLT
jgi:xanthine dehydrogenase iron-sulfur cluster and FAD-binding subunit A